MSDFRLLSFRYSPGYGDMLGGSHSVSLRREKDGAWTVTVSDREIHSSPTVVKKYAASEEDVRRLGEFISKNRIASLEKRPKDDMFVTDYSPWSVSFDYEKTSFGRVSRKYCGFDEYQKYSPRDGRLIKELLGIFDSLRGELISETVEED